MVFVDISYISPTNQEILNRALDFIQAAMYPFALDCSKFWFYACSKETVSLEIHIFLDAQGKFPYSFIQKTASCQFVIRVILEFMSRNRADTDRGKIVVMDG